MRWFVGLYDYDPSTMSPNPDGCVEELSFREGERIKVFGDRDADGFYWGEVRGRKGFIPENTVAEVTSPDAGGDPYYHRGDRVGDTYAATPVKKMVALYDYDPQELSPNVDADVSAVRLRAPRLEKGCEIRSRNDIEKTSIRTFRYRCDIVMLL